MLAIEISLKIYSSFFDVYKISVTTININGKDLLI